MPLQATARARGLGAIAAALALATVHPAWAAPEGAPPSVTLQAKAHFRAGTMLYGQARYREAIAEFEAAYRLRPHGVLFYNLAQCHERLGDIPAALRAYHDYLRAAPGAEDRAAVKRKIVRRLSKLANSLLASGAIEPPAQQTLAADPRPRTYRTARKK